MGQASMPFMHITDDQSQTPTYIRHRALQSMSQGQRPFQYTSGHQDIGQTCSNPRQSQNGVRSSMASSPPPGRKAVSAYSSSSHTQQADFTQSTLNLVTCVLGAGALGYPFCFKECGLLLATIIMFVTLVATRISYQLLLYCAQLSGRKSYEGIAEQALGKTGRQVVEFCIAATNLGALVAFLDILADVLSSVAGTIIPPGAEPSRHAYITGVTLAGALPISLLVREPSLIANMSNAAVVFVMVFAAVVFCTAFGPSAAAALGVRWAALTHDTRAAAAAAAVPVPVLHMWNPQGVLVSLPVMAYGFTAHQYYMGIYSMLKAPTVRKMKQVTDMALLVCAGVYWTVGVGGYATFGDRTAGDIIRNFGGQRAVGMWGAYERALKLCYGMAVLGNIPLVILPFSSILAPLLPGDEKIKQQTSSLAQACTVAGAKRATAAALSGCSSGTGSSSVHIHKARCSSSTGGAGIGSSKQHVSDNGSRCAGGELATQLDTEALLLEAPTWQEPRTHVPNSSPSQRQPWQPQQQRLHLPPPQHPQQQRQQQYMPEEQLLLADARSGSPEEVPEHPHLTKDACRAAHMLTGPQHTLVVVLVLGLGLASAVWLPNVELIFGLTGSTASVLAAFIMPAICFLRLYDMAPELGSGKRGSSSGSTSSLWWLLKQVACCCCGFGSFLGRGRSRSRANSARVHSSPGGSKRPYSSSNSLWGQAAPSNGDQHQGHAGSKVWGPVLVVPELRAQWACRQRLAFVLLAFGLISGLLCTDAILSSISQEKAVVQLAQELVAHEAVVAETSRAQQKAKEAAAAVDAVSSAAQQLGAVDTTTNQTLGSLTAAAAALNTIARPQDKAGDSKQQHGNDRQQHPSVWDLKRRIEQHKQKIAEDSVLRNVEAALSTAAADLAATTASVTAVIIKLDTSIAQIKADAAASSAAAAAATTPAAAKQASGGDSGPAGAGAQGPTPEAAVGIKAPDGTVVTTPAAGATGSAAIVPHGDELPKAQDDQQQQQQQPAGPAGAADGSKVGGSTGAARSSGSGGEAYARANEMARELGKALGTLGHGGAAANLTLTAGKSLEQVRDSAIAALTALNVTADVLRQVRAAVGAARHSQQRDSQVKELAVQAMQRALNATAASALAMRITREALGTAATEETSELLTALTRVAQDLEKSETAAGASKKRASITISSDDGSGSAGGGPGQVAAAGAAGSGSGAVTVSDRVKEPASGGVDESAGSHEGASSSGTPGSADAPTATQPTAQPLAKHPTVAEHEAAVAAAANAAAHAESESTTAGQQQAQQQSPADMAAVQTPETSPAAGAVVGAASQKQSVAFTDTAVAAEAAAAAAANAAAHADAATAAAMPQPQQQAATQPRGAPSTADAPASTGSHDGSSSAAGEQRPAPTTATAGVADASSSKQLPEQPALTASEADKIKGIIQHLAAAMSAGGGSGSGSSGASTTATGAPGSANAAGVTHGTATTNITQLAAAIHDAVAWTQQSKSAVMKLIVADLGQTDPKVVERVMGIVQEVSTTESEADRQRENQQAVAAAAAAVDAAGSADGRPNQQPSEQTPQDAKVAGPVVTVLADGQLQQQGGATGTEGPVVPDAPQPAAPSVAAVGSPPGLTDGTGAARPGMAGAGAGSSGAGGSTAVEVGSATASPAAATGGTTARDSATAAVHGSIQQLADMV